MLTAVIPSCVKEDVPRETVEEPGKTAQVIATLDPEIATKADIDGISGDFTWTAGDKLSIWCATGTVAGDVKGTYNEATLTSGAGNNEAVFTVNLSGYRDRFALYPANIKNVDNTGGGDGSPLWVNLPTAYENPQHTPLPMIAENVAGEVLAFHHAGSLLRLTLRNLPSGVKCIKVNTGENITGNFEVDTLDKDKPLISIDGNRGGNGKTISFSKFSPALTTGGEVTLDVPLPTGLHYNLTVVLFSNDAGDNGYWIGRVQRGSARYFERGSGKAVVIDLPPAGNSLKLRLRDFSMSNVDLNSGKSTKLVLGNSDPTRITATIGQSGSTESSTTALKAYSGLSITAWTLDPSIASVSASVENGLPVINVKGMRDGKTTLVAMARYGEDTMYARSIIRVNDQSYNITINNPHEQGLASGFSRSLSSTFKNGDDVETADSYEWVITERMGAGDATITTLGGSATLTAGLETGHIRFVCRATKGSVTVESTPVGLDIVRAPAGTFPGSFTVAATPSEPVFFSTGNLICYREGDFGRYTFEKPQYFIYSGYYDDDNYNQQNAVYRVPDYTDNKAWDKFPKKVLIDNFANRESTGFVEVPMDDDYIQTFGWFALNEAQWKYLLNTRKGSTVCGTANARYVKARVGLMYGLILFPDDYVHPDDRIELTNINNYSLSLANFVRLTTDEFDVLETAGAVFLPYAGYYEGGYANLNAQGHYAFYKSATKIGKFKSVTSSWEFPETDNAAYYYPIRLVHYQ